MNKQKKIANELRTLIKAPNECSDDEIMDITKGSLFKASVELSLAVEELSSALRKEFPCSQNAHNAILKLQNFFNKKS